MLPYPRLITTPAMSLALQMDLPSGQLQSDGVHPLVDFSAQGPGLLIDHIAQQLPTSVGGLHPADWDDQSALMHKVLKEMGRLDGVGLVTRLLSSHLPPDKALALMASSLCGVVPEALVALVSHHPPQTLLEYINARVLPLLPGHAPGVLIVVDVLLSRVGRLRQQAGHRIATLRDAFPGWLPAIVQILCSPPPPVAPYSSDDQRQAAARAHELVFDVAATLYEAMIDKGVPEAASVTHIRAFLNFALQGNGRTAQALDLFRLAVGEQSPPLSLELLESLLGQLPAMQCPTVPSDPAAHKSFVLHEAIATVVKNLRGTRLNDDLYNKLKGLTDGNDVGFVYWDVSTACLVGCEDVWASAIYMVTSTAAMILPLSTRCMVVDKLEELLHYHMIQQLLPDIVLAEVFRGLSRLLREDGEAIGLKAAAPLLAFGKTLQDLDITNKAAVERIYPFAHECRGCLLLLLECLVQCPQAGCPMLTPEESNALEGVCAKLKEIQNRTDEEDEEEDAGGAETEDDLEMALGGGEEDGENMDMSG